MFTSISGILMTLGVVILIAAIAGKTTKKLNGRRLKLISLVGLAMLVISMALGYTSAIEGFKAGWNS